MYSYDDIAFRPIEKQDLEILRQLHNDQSTFLNLLNIDLIDENAQLEWWSGLHNKSGDKRYAIVKADDPGRVIGRLRIQNINLMHRNCEVGLDIVMEFRGKGYGYKSYRMLLEFLFEHYNMNMVYLKAADFNAGGKHLYEKVGFRETGRLPQFYFRHGRYWDYVIMSITREEYAPHVPPSHNDSPNS